MNNSSSGRRWVKTLLLLLGAAGLCALAYAIYYENFRKPKLFYHSDHSHIHPAFSDKLGTYIFFDDWREFVVVIVTTDTSLSPHGYDEREVTYQDATLFKRTQHETKVAEGWQQMLVCFPDERLEFPIPEGAISDWIMSLKLPADGRLEDMNLLREVGRILNSHDREKLEKAAQSHGL